MGEAWAEAERQAALIVAYPKHFRVALLDLLTDDVTDIAVEVVREVAR